MALSISCENPIIKLCISGCHNGDCITNSNGCENNEIFTEVFHPYVVTPITRLFLHVQFNRKHKIDVLIKNFENHFESGQNYEENGIEYFKKIILEDLETDSSWKVCPKCSSEYKNKIRKFEKINYIVPYVDLCIFHKKVM